MDVRATLQKKAFTWRHPVCISLDTSLFKSMDYAECKIASAPIEETIDLQQSYAISHQERAKCNEGRNN